MTVSFSDFLQLLVSDPIIAVTVLLTLGVILVNGWTDAPNAIATCVSTRAMKPIKTSANKETEQCLKICFYSL